VQVNVVQMSGLECSCNGEETRQRSYTRDPLLAPGGRDGSWERRDSVGVTIILVAFGVSLNRTKRS
jgi:hypothetical protein